MAEQQWTCQSHPTKQHETITRKLVFSVNDALTGMGLDWNDAEWVGGATYKPTTAIGKVPDDAFLPPPRCTTPVSEIGWPTLVIETGVSESMPRLRVDAAKWFSDSKGKVRITLVISIKDSSVDVERWQLAPIGAPTPLTRDYIASLCRRPPNRPPLYSQDPAAQQPYCAQQIIITRQGATGDLVLPFDALYDRSPEQGEHDVLITSTDFMRLTQRLW
ncbi:uncharacterized protein N7515_005473 [Penicillium bovifimosum]|uniref:Uncharacterized protein n=1 Tax=Penicillium bovifimosum TaxID=126998 RepID=A0A9W9GST8_9EURO|nr:uncharacterized protein N7515_005473 [Penicillium bovifimosum]KAJ5129434.1 hypothetical protein N7515_005473 [Penicillium bovifimosum]